jgi:hypothetical protein
MCFYPLFAKQLTLTRLKNRHRYIMLYYVPLPGTEPLYHSFQCCYTDKSGVLTSPERSVCEAVENFSSWLRTDTSRLLSLGCSRVRSSCHAEHSVQGKDRVSILAGRGTINIWQMYWQQYNDRKIFCQGWKTCSVLGQEACKFTGKTRRHIDN